MSLQEIREKNKRKDSFIYSKIERAIEPKLAQEIKNDVFKGFIEPIGTATLVRYMENNENE